MKKLIGLSVTAIGILTACGSGGGSASNAIEDLYQAAEEGDSETFDEINFSGVFEEEIANHVENSGGLDNITFEEYNTDDFDDDYFSEGFDEFAEEIQAEDAYFVVETVEEPVETRDEEDSVMWIVTDHEGDGYIAYAYLFMSFEEFQEGLEEGT